MRTLRKIPNWQFFAAIGLLVCLIAVLANPAQLLCAAAFLLVPVLFFGLLPVLPSFWPADNFDFVRKPQQLARTPLFQRPPPPFTR